MKYINLIAVSGLLISNSHDSLAAISHAHTSAVYPSSPSDNVRLSIDSGPVSPRPTPSASASASASLPTPLFPTLMGDSSEASSLPGRRSSVGSWDSLSRDGDLEDVLNELMGKSSAAAPAPQAASPSPSRISLDAYPSDAETYTISSEFLAGLDCEICDHKIATPTEYASSDSEDESVPPAPKTPVPALEALPAVFQHVASPVPSTVPEYSSPSNRLMPKSPNVTPGRAGEKRKRAQESEAVAISRAPGLVRALSYEADNE